MSFLEAVLLGIVQGLTEFLPVSSSGHLVLFEMFMAPAGDHLGFNVAVHIGTLLSVLTVYRRAIWQILSQSKDFLATRQNNTGSQLVFYVIVASVPTGLMGVFLRDFWHQLFSNLLAVGVCLCLTGTLLWLTRKVSTQKGALTDQLPESLPGLNWKKALLIGLAQGCAIAPGISRSGSTIAASLLLGCDRQLAALFSFLLMIPAIMGATLLEFSQVTWTAEVIQQMLTGLVVAYLAGLVGLKIVLKAVKNGRLEFFTPYLFTVGISAVIYALFQ